MKFKSFLLYIVLTMLAILLFSSFETEKHLAYSKELNLSPERMYLSYVDDKEKLALLKVEVEDVETKASEYVLGDTSEFIVEYKNILYYLNLLNYPVDDVFDELLKTAVGNYQTQRNLAVTSSLNEETMSMLESEVLEYSKGHKGSVIYDCKLKLKEFLYFPAETVINDNFDQLTLEAVNKYQSMMKIQVTGTLTQETIESLEKPLEEQVLNVNPEDLLPKEPTEPTEPSEE